MLAVLFVPLLSARGTLARNSTLRQRKTHFFLSQFERVFRDEGEAISPLIERVLKHRGQIGVALDRHHAPRALQQRNSESSDSRTHFKHVIRGVKLRKLDDLLQNCIVNQEVLAERMLRRKTMLLQDIARCRRSCQGESILATAVALLRVTFLCGALRSRAALLAASFALSTASFARAATCMQPLRLAVRARRLLAAGLTRRALRMGRFRTTRIVERKPRAYTTARAARRSRFGRILFARTRRLFHLGERYNRSPVTFCTLRGRHSRVSSCEEVLDRANLSIGRDLAALVDLPHPVEHGFQTEPRNSERRADDGHKRGKPMRIAALAHHMQHGRALFLDARIRPIVRLQSIEQRLQLRRRPAKYTGTTTVISSAESMSFIDFLHVVVDDARGEIVVNCLLAEPRQAWQCCRGMHRNLCTLPRQAWKPVQAQARHRGIPRCRSQTAYWPGARFYRSCAAIRR